jgi:hypothetical protein
MKIAAKYGLQYASSKTSESTILYHLRRNGIQRRDPAAHIRKVTKQMVDEWTSRYQKGESLKQIAGGQVDPVTVWNHLRSRGVQLRAKVEAQIQAVSKHVRTPFGGESVEKAYLTGLKMGDFYAAMHGRLVRVKTASTHPAMYSLFRHCFEPYGHIYTLPKRTPLTGFEWTFTCDLDSSFGFLLESNQWVPKFVRGNALFLSFLAGFFDAEGSIYMNGSGWFELSITNSNLDLLRVVKRRLKSTGIVSRIVGGDPTPLSKATKIWRLRVWRRNDVRLLLEKMPVRHPEKVEKARIAVSAYGDQTNPGLSIIDSWNRLAQSIESERMRYIEEAEVAYLKRRNLQGRAGASTIGPPLPANNSNPNR